MNKMMMSVLGMGAVVLMTGCGGSPSSVAEDFAEALIQREAEDAIACYDTVSMSVDEIKAMKESFEQTGKSIDDTKLTVQTINEVVRVPPEDSGYKLVNGKKVTGEDATVTVQFVKGKDLKDYGMTVKLRKIGGKWKVTGYKNANGLCTATK